MPEYMTKSEPVDKKPYIVYTDEKGILYSGDPDSDIPGGSSTVKCYIVNDGGWNTPFNIGDLTVIDRNGASVSVSTDELTSEGPMGTETHACLSFTANVGGLYKIGDGNKQVAGGILNTTSIGLDSQLPSIFENAEFSFIAPNVDVVAAITVEA